MKWKIHLANLFTQGRGEIKTEYYPEIELLQERSYKRRQRQFCNLTDHDTTYFMAS